MKYLQRSKIFLEQAKGMHGLISIFIIISNIISYILTIVKIIFSYSFALKLFLLLPTVTKHPPVSLQSIDHLLFLTMTMFLVNINYPILAFVFLLCGRSLRLASNE